METKSAAAKSTFNNLPDDKRRRILAEAVREFAAQGYRQASVNAIVGRVGIAKGSLYQYFANKEALFFFVFEQFSQLVKAMVKEAAGDDEREDFFARIGRVLFAGMAFIDRYPEYYQIYLKVLFERDVPDRELLISRVRLFSVEYFGPYCEEAKQMGQIRADIPNRLVFFMLDAVLDRFFQAYARPDSEIGMARAGSEGRPAMQEEVAMVIGVLRDGLSG